MTFELGARVHNHGVGFCGWGARAAPWAIAGRVQASAARGVSRGGGWAIETGAVVAGRPVGRLAMRTAGSKRAIFGRSGRRDLVGARRRRRRQIVKWPLSADVTVRTVLMAVQAHASKAVRTLPLKRACVSKRRAGKRGWRTSRTTAGAIAAKAQRRVPNSQLQPSHLSAHHASGPLAAFQSFRQRPTYRSQSLSRRPTCRPQSRRLVMMSPRSRFKLWPLPMSERAAPGCPNGPRNAGAWLPLGSRRASLLRSFGSCKRTLSC